MPCLQFFLWSWCSANGFVWIFIPTPPLLHHQHLVSVDSDVPISLAISVHDSGWPDGGDWGRKQSQTLCTTSSTTTSSCSSQITSTTCCTAASARRRRKYRPSGREAVKNELRRQALMTTCCLLQSPKPHTLMLKQPCSLIILSQNIFFFTPFHYI